MTATAPTSGSIEARSTDLRRELAERFACAPLIACDIETSGLDWSIDRIAMIQLYTPGEPPAIVRVNGKVPERAAALLENDRIVKIFHHAMFDLRFMAHHWRIEARNIRCTKIAAKLLYPNDRERQSLNALIADHLGFTIDKSEQKSDWSAPQLSQSQLAYATNDVVHLPALFDVLQQRLLDRGLWDLATACFSHVPTRVKLEVDGFGDPFTY
jgi:ribonuclease D